jgi:hypothetical protein
MGSDATSSARHRQHRGVREEADRLSLEDYNVD